MNSPSWLSSLNDQMIEVHVPADAVLLVLIASPQGEKAVKSSKAALLLADQLVLFEKNPEKLILWLKPQITELGASSSFRLLGIEKAFSALNKALNSAGLLPGKNVPLTGASVIHFLPQEGRVRLMKEPSASGPVVSEAPKAGIAKKIRVLVVDDSESISKLLSRILNEDPEIECVATVGLPSLVEAAIAKYKPDVLTLDIHMPEMDGVALLKKLLPIYSLPTIMISALSREDGTYVLDALEAGAIDYIQKPSMAEIKTVAPLICEKIKTASLSKAQSGKNRTLKSSPSVSAKSISGIDPAFLIAIGSSTGGTEALKEVLTNLPDEIPPILIVQHIPAFFSKAFADRINLLCPFEVKEAENGERVTRNKVLIAPGGKQMKVISVKEEMEIVIDDSPPVNRHKPSVDALFDSILSLNRRKIVAAILTGMGADGAKGMLKLRKAGAHTFGQDEATSIVYGMPREAAKIGAVEQVLPLGEIALGLMKACLYSKK